jgi:hypothetical protein
MMRSPFTPTIPSSFVPATKPVNVATVPPTVDIEFATRRCSRFTRPGVAALAVARKKRFSETTPIVGAYRSAPVPEMGMRPIAPTARTKGVRVRMRRLDHRSMSTPASGAITENGMISSA